MLFNIIWKAVTELSIKQMSNWVTKKQQKKKNPSFYSEMCYDALNWINS